MIAGLGADIVNIERIEKILSRFDEHFVSRFFAPSEQEDIRAAFKSDRQRACKTAKYFAAKEAAAKALGTGFRDGIEWREIVVRHDEFGAPQLVFGGKALERAQKLCPGGDFRILLSLSDDYPFAQAVVIIEKI